ncbi:hypothetical protein BS50DRAFT_336686 [Corynespora cassiicola Philippines]|uniref:Uncharacterized protein n=1 Tax=Corynespora cassiicola Philippines TaxID=1448308 RepID=A0A2T2NVD4_CORCC|nr:hypothetical protein BS50DRAFT_336686 [Corynespora cassiicola Philippines]
MPSNKQTQNTSRGKPKPRRMERTGNPPSLYHPRGRRRLTHPTTSYLCYPHLRSPLVCSREELIGRGERDTTSIVTVTVPFARYR